MKIEMNDNAVKLLLSLLKVADPFGFFAGALADDIRKQAESQVVIDTPQFVEVKK
jgi:hypothetical protein